MNPLYQIESGATLTIPLEPGAPPWYLIYYIIVGLSLFLAIVLGQRVFVNALR